MSAITLTREGLETEGIPNGSQHTWPLKVTAVSTVTGIPSEIFVYHQGASSSTQLPNDPHPGDLCEAIASVHQLSELPAAEPPAPGNMSRVPFYRSATAFFQCHSLVEADQVWAIIQEDVADLIANMEASQNLATAEVVAIEPVAEEI